MGRYGHGDMGKMICSSDEEEGYRPVSELPSRTNSMMSEMNINDKRYLIFGTFGEAPSFPLPPVSDETDRQFWAEDELSSSDSRHLMIHRRKRRRSVAYRNRSAVHRSRSEYVQSSSSSTETTQLNIPPLVRKRRGPSGPLRAQRTRTTSGAGHSKMNPKTLLRLVSAGNELVSSGCDLIQPTVYDQRYFISTLTSTRNDEANTPRTSANQPPSRTASKSDANSAKRNRIGKLKLPHKSKRK